jgi:hypothetical protein
MCRDKKRYETKDLARAAKQKFFNGSKKVNIYFCDYCKYWHVGTTREYHDGQRAKTP